MSNIDAAKNCFSENLNLFSDTKQSPDRFNLYKGLFFLAETVQSLESDIRHMENQLNHIASRLR